MAEFNPNQKLAVECDTHLLVVAPPGSGKTGTLVGKALRILRQPDRRVAMVTFTRAAASEMRERVLAKRGKTIGTRITAETFHRYALNQLRSLQGAPRLLDNHAMRDLVTSAIAESGAALSYEEALALIESHKSQLSFGAEAAGATQAPRPSPGDAADEVATNTAHDLVRAYQEMLRSRRAVDLMDVVRLAVQGMRAGRIKPLPVSDLLCDEMQDADAWQLQWCLEHARAGVTTTLVGDDDQSLYAFRHALGYAGMTQFRDEVQAQQINLTINYRSRHEILLAAGAVIRHNVQRLDKEVLCARGTGGTVRALACSSCDDEAKQVVDMIVASDPERTWGVIARTNFGLRTIATELRARAIAYTRREDVDEDDPGTLAFARMLVALETADTMCLEGALRAFGIGGRSIEVLRRLMGLDFPAILDDELPDLGELDEEDATALRKLARVYFAPWRDILAQGQPGKVVDRVAHFIERETRLVGDPNREDFDANVRRVRERKGPFKARTAYILIPNRSQDKAAARVDLQTFHGAKGLEYDAVAVLRCHEGELPSPKATDFEEERRGFYVALTRARHELYISWVTSLGRPAPFVREALEVIGEGADAASAAVAEAA